MKNPISDDQNNYFMSYVSDPKVMSPSELERLVMNDVEPSEFGGRVAIGSRRQHGEVPIYSRGAPVRKQFYRHYKPLYTLEYSIYQENWVLREESTHLHGFRICRNKS